MLFSPSRQPQRATHTNHPGGFPEFDVGMSHFWNRFRHHPWDGLAPIVNTGTLMVRSITQHRTSPHAVMFCIWPVSQIPLARLCISLYLPHLRLQHRTADPFPCLASSHERCADLLSDWLRFPNRSQKSSRGRVTAMAIPSASIETHLRPSPPAGYRRSLPLRVRLAAVGAIVCGHVGNAVFSQSPYSPRTVPVQSPYSPGWEKPQSP